MLTMVIPLYISEVSTPDIRGSLVVLQQCKPPNTRLDPAKMINAHSTYQYQSQLAFLQASGLITGPTTSAAPAALPIFPILAEPPVIEPLILTQMLVQTDVPANQTLRGEYPSLFR